MPINSRVERVGVDAPEFNGLEIRVDTPAGFAEYRLRPGRIVFTHTEVDSAFEGQGIGSALVQVPLSGPGKRGCA